MWSLAQERQRSRIALRPSHADENDSAPRMNKWWFSDQRIADRNVADAKRANKHQ
jgi:hypothetical protein